MGKTIYQKCVKMLEFKKGEILTLDVLKSLIMMNIGSDYRTMNQALETMSLTRLIKDVDNFRFEVL